MIMIESRFFQAAGVAAAAILLVSCQAGDSQGPGGIDLSFDGAPSFASVAPTVPITSVPQVRPYPGTKVAGEVAVCKDASSPAGHYYFAITTMNAQPGDMIADTVIVSPGYCVVVYNRVNRVATGGPATQVHITEVIPPDATYHLNHVVRDDDAHGSLIRPGPAVSVLVNSNHGAFATFYNVAGPANGVSTTSGHGNPHHGNGHR
jgi:hypothetical protein